MPAMIHAHWHPTTILLTQESHMMQQEVYIRDGGGIETKYPVEK